MLRFAALLALALVAGPAWGQSCTTTLNAGAAVGTAISNASAGDVICLNNGNYSGFTLNGVTKSPRVTVKAVNNLQASFTGDIDIIGNSYGITFDGFNFVNVLVYGANTRELTFQNYNQTGKFEIDAVTHATPNIVLQDFTHNNVTAAQAPNARINFSFSGRSSPVATVRRGVIDGGCADGIQSGVPFIVEDSDFKNMQVGSCPNDPHTDALQLYGGPFSGTIIRRNYFYKNVQVLTAYDGVDGVLIENNIFDPGPDGERRECQIEWYSDDTSTIRHNTVVWRGNGFGVICLDKKTADDAGFGTIITDNIVYSIETANGSTYGTRTHNLVQSGAAAGDITGTPTFTGGTYPTTRAGFVLTAQSAGKGAAYDPSGSDIGAITSSLLPGPGNPRWRPAWNDWFEFYRFALWQ